MNQTRILIGCGYLGSRVAKYWRAAGDDVIATSRHEHLSPEMIATGVFPARADVTRPDTLKWLQYAPALSGQAVKSLIYSVGYDHNAGPDIHTVYAEGLQNVLAALPSSAGRVIYISTTGVYGPASGEWVDENTPTNPQRDGGRASLAAEQMLAAHPIGKRSIILRLAGIYGPNRIPYIDKLLANEPLAVPTEGWLNLIHVDDAAAIVVAIDKWAAENPITNGPAVFCVSDGHPVVRGDYYREVARLSGTAKPRFVEPDPNSPAAQRARSDKRISNRKLVETLNYDFRYPNYRTGLAAILGNSA
jgi:nucleoside-diphosphate-sugar epimerase